MCGIITIYGKDARRWEPNLDAMLDKVSCHRPDDCGTYVDSNIGMGQIRLSVMDVAGGK